MGAALAPIAGGVLGGLGGILGGQKQGGVQLPGTLLSSPDQQAKLQDQMLAGYSNAPTAAGAEKAVGSSPIFGQLYGQGGTLGRTTAEEQQLASQGFNLTPEDRTAYGQISGDIARQFGQSGQSMAQALADRGLSSSGVAARQFSGLEGNKQEQLAKLQQNIAQQRYQMNLQRLGQTRNFLNQLGAGAQQATEGEFGREYQGTVGKSQAIQNLLNNQYQQQKGSSELERQTQGPSGLAQGLSGAISGAGIGMNSRSLFPSGSQGTFGGSMSNG